MTNPGAMWEELRRIRRGLEVWSRDRTLLEAEAMIEAELERDDRERDEVCAGVGCGGCGWSGLAVGRRA